ncbi:MAG: UDP-galactopyranose mutase [Alphaproteobacteria bacterium]|nr:UDP-galactopyranose mutase [Alphaproteobacteria bacterium]
MTRFARIMPVFYFEEPHVEGTEPPRLVLHPIGEQLTVVVPHLPQGLGAAGEMAAQRKLVHDFCTERGIRNPLLWFYTPMALRFAGDLPGCATVYDCMDELSAFAGAPPELRALEAELMARADLVFTGGISLYEAKRAQHPDVHAFPSAVDAAHFAQARQPLPDPPDQAALPHPRLGFFGVIDERLDRDLLAELARLRPDWQLVMLGPVVKIDPATLPRAGNIHYLGPKDYQELPAYVANWAAALMPFARNEATRFISPTKTPEYLAAGKPVVATPITDVIRQWGHFEAVRIAETATDFAAAAARAVAMAARGGTWRDLVDRELAVLSWDASWERMAGLIEDALVTRTVLPTTKPSLPEKSAFAPSLLPVRRSGFDYLVVGAGFAGSVLAERLAAGSGKRVLIVDRRPHIGGNAYDSYNDDGILVQRYGPHIFHTNSRQVSDYLSRFTAWRPYEHRVLAAVRGHLLPIPINRTTINRLFGLALSEAEVGDFLAQQAEPVARIRTAEDVVRSQVGGELYETFFRGYTRKQWGLDPAQLDKSVTARIPVRTNDDDRYFTDSFQMMPRHGFTRLFENMLDHPNIKIMLNADYREIIDDIEYGRMIYTGPIDEFFDCRYGKLPYRSLRFQHQTLERPRAQPVAVINYPAEDVPYTRVTEYKHLTGQAHAKTAISYEFPSSEGDPYYPIPRPDNAVLYARYRELADALPDIEFVGRLATYRYYNMDQVVAQALAAYARISQAEPEARRSAATGRGAAAALT